MKALIEFFQKLLKLKRKPLLLIDGSNVAMSTKSARGSVDYLVQALEWGKKSGYQPQVIIDKSLLPRIDERERLNELIKKGLVEVASGTSADLVILERAEKESAFIMTNDKFKEFQNMFPWLSREKRIIRFVFKEKKLKIKGYFVSSSR